MNFESIKSAISFSTSRSTGPGGQHVNKVETKVTLYLPLSQADGITEEERIMIRQKLSNQINQHDQLIIHAEQFRSQLKNKELAIKKLHLALLKALAKPKPRKPTRPKASAIAERILDKKRHAEKKSNRRKPLL